MTTAVSGAGPSPGLLGVESFGTSLHPSVKVLGTLFSFNLI